MTSTVVAEMAIGQLLTEDGLTAVAATESPGATGKSSKDVVGIDGPYPITVTHPDFTAVTTPGNK